MELNELQTLARSKSLVSRSVWSAHDSVTAFLLAGSDGVPLYEEEVFTL